MKITITEGMFCCESSYEKKYRAEHGIWARQWMEMIYGILLNVMIQHVAVEGNVYSFAVTFAITFTLWFTSWSHTYIFSVLSNTLWHLLLSSIEDIKNPFIRLRVKTWNNVAPFHRIQGYRIVIWKNWWSRATNYSIIIKYKNTKWYVLAQHFFNWCKQWNEQEKDERDWFEVVNELLNIQVIVCR